MRYVILVLGAACSMACGADALDTSDTAHQIPLYEGPPCSDSRECGHGEWCIVPPTVALDTPTDGTCWTGPMPTTHCLRIVEQGVVTTEICS